MYIERRQVSAQVRNAAQETYDVYLKKLNTLNDLRNKLEQVFIY